MADVFQARVEQIAVTESAALGAAMRAAHTVGGSSWKDLEDKFTAPTGVTLPNADTAARYEQCLRAFALLETA